MFAPSLRTHLRDARRRESPVVPTRIASTDLAGGRPVSTVALVVRHVRASFVTACLSLLVCAAAAHAQNGRITGSVTDSSAGYPVTGVTIAVTGTNLAGITTDNGRYTIVGVPPGPD